MTAGRLDDLLPDRLNAAQRTLYDTYLHGHRATRPPPFPMADAAGRLNGPARAWLLQPALGAGLERLGAAISHELTLPPRTREIVILTVAHHHDSPFEEYAHRLGATRAGLTPEEIEELCAGRAPATADGPERCAHRTARALLAHSRLTDAGYQEAVRLLGRDGLFEVTTLTGFYTLMALHLSVYAITPPDAA